MGVGLVPCDAATRLIATLVAVTCTACEPAEMLQIVAEESFAEDTPALDGDVPEVADVPLAQHPPRAADDVEGDRVDAAEAARFAEFMVEFCTKVRRANGKYIEQHVALPLTTTIRGADADGDDGLVEVTYRNAWEFKESGICADLTWLGCGLDIEVAKEGWRLRAGHGSAATELVLEPLGSSYKLIGMRPAP